MKILINGVNLKVGGGVTVLMNFLKVVIENTSFHKHAYHVIVPSGIGYEKFNEHPVSIEIMPEAMKSPLKRLWLDYSWLSKRISEIAPDVVFSMGNIAVPTNVRQGVLFAYPYAIYPKDKKVWEILDLFTRLDYRARNFIFKKRLKYADVIFPQTITSEIRLHKYYGRRIKKTKVVPNAYSKIDSGRLELNFFERRDNVIYLLALTKYYKHKNLEILIPLAEKIKENDYNIKLIVTVEKDQGVGAREFIQSISSHNLEDYIVNIGKVPFGHVPSLYGDVDGLLLPTLLESFSGTYADSLSLGIPVFTSDRDFAKDVCGDAAFYFDPLDANDIFNAITSAFDNKDQIAEKIHIGLVRSAHFLDWIDVAGLFIGELELINND